MGYLKSGLSRSVAVLSACGVITASAVGFAALDKTVIKPCDVLPPDSSEVQQEEIPTVSVERRCWFRRGRRAIFWTGIISVAESIPTLGFPRRTGMKISGGLRRLLRYSGMRVLSRWFPLFLHFVKCGNLQGKRRE